ncbi:laccase domain-containing protein, partial [Brevibacterium paucivorans]
MLQARHVLSGSAGKAHVAFTDRWGGYSSGRFSSLNLGRSVGDDDTLVDANRSALAAA